MAGAKVRWRLERERFEVLGHGELWFGENGTIVGAADVAEVASLVELRRALDRYRATMYDDEAFALEIYDESSDLIAQAEDYLNPIPVSLQFTREHTFLLAVVALLPSDELDRDESAAALEPLLARHRARFVEIRESRGSAIIRAKSNA